MHPGELTKIALVVVALPTVAWAQSANPPKFSFDTASVKLTTPPKGVTAINGGFMASVGSSVQIPRNTGGPGTNDPGRIHYPLITLHELLKRAWDAAFEIQSPDWLNNQLVAIDATMPATTTKEQFREMLQNLVIDRFGLKFHVEQKETSGYNLVLARIGPKMKQSPDQSDSEPGPRSQPAARDTDGFPIVPPRTGTWCDSLTIPGARRLVCQQQTMGDLARRLLPEPNSIVKDATGLTARYDFVLTWSDREPVSPPPPDGAESQPDIFTAVQSELGLRLEAKRVAIEVMIVDHIEKTPTRN